MTPRSLALAAVIFIAPFAIAESPKSDVDLISAYVVSHKHWSPNIFRIKRKDCDCAFAYYEIIYLPELKNAVPGGGKSFGIYYDEHLHKVIKEEHFQ